MADRFAHPLFSTVERSSNQDSQVLGDRVNRTRRRGDNWQGLEPLEPRLLMHGEINLAVGATWDSCLPEWAATLMRGEIDLAIGATVAPVIGPVVNNLSTEDGGMHNDEHDDQHPPTHPDDPGKQHEHEALLNLVDHEDATHTAVQDGVWSDPLTWENGLIPNLLADVLIPDNVDIVFDAILTDPLHTVRVDGVLQFDTHVDTQMLVDTFVVSSQGLLVVGTDQNPIDDDVTARFVIADLGKIDTDWDPLQLSRGLISYGSVMMHGDYKTPYLALNEALRGDTELVLAEVPENWRVGDQIVLTGTRRWNNQDEELDILAIDGNRITVDRLKYNHYSPYDQSIYVANVSRNVVVISENVGTINRRGHAMFMHAPTVSVHNAGFYGLGRSDKRNVVDDPMFNEDGNLLEGTGLNPRGRYAAHFHRHGDRLVTDPAVITASVVVDSPGWGFVNHDSHVIMEDNISFDVVGAGFVTENGTEVGAFRRNLAIRSKGSGDRLESRDISHDFGHGGHGFWFQGAGVEVEGNIASGHAGAAFIYFTRSEVADFKAENLADPTWADGREQVPVGNVPIRLFKGNVAFASRTGFESWFHLLNAKHDGRSVVEDFIVWNTRAKGMIIPYTANMTLKNVKLFGRTASLSQIGIGVNKATRNIRFENIHAEGWKIGVQMPRKGQNILDGGYFNNVRSIEISKAHDLRRTIDIIGDVKFGQLTDAALQGRRQLDYLMRADVKVKDRNITKLFSPDVTRMGTIRFDGKQFFFHEQAPDYVYFRADEAPDYIPPELIGKTNQQLWDQYGVAIGGSLAPVDAVEDPHVGGLIGTPATYLPNLQQKSRKYTNQLDGYTLKYLDAGGQRVVDPLPVNLREGWNLITREIGGHKRTFFVFGDTKAVTFLYDTTRHLVINPEALSNGFRVEGQIFDESFGFKRFQRKLSGKKIKAMPVEVRADGTKYIVLEFHVRDRARNKTTVRLELTLDPNAPLNPLGPQRNLSPRVLSITLTKLHDHYVMTAQLV